MPRPNPGRTPVFHIIPIEKLGSVIAHGLLSDAEAERRFGSSRPHDAAHPDLKQARRRRRVNVSAGGVMSDYVPFYFGPRSPMLYAIWRGQTDYGRSGRGQPGMIHLVCRLERLARDFPEGWCFLDGHLTRLWTQFGDTIGELDQRVDFNVMRARMWDKPDEVRAARQAEFLVHRVVPWEYVELVVTVNDDVAAEVRATMDASAMRHTPDVSVRPPGRYEPPAAFPNGYYY